MSDALSPGFAILLAISMAASFIWIMSEVGRRTAVRGSRPRYLYATVERATRWPCLLYFLMSLTTDRIYGSWQFLIIDAAGLGLWVFVQWERRRNGDDDDDFWTGLSKKLRERFGAGRVALQGAAGRFAVPESRAGLNVSTARRGLTEPLRHSDAMTILAPSLRAPQAVLS